MVISYAHHFSLYFSIRLFGEMGYRHSAYQLVLADGGNGATGGRGQAVFGTCLATGEHRRWERYDVLGEIKPDHMPQWAKEALARTKAQEKEKKSKSREGR